MSTAEGPLTLAIDIGGTGLKADVIDARGQPVVERKRVPTPHPAPPEKIIDAVRTMTVLLPPFEIAIGIPRWNVAIPLICQPPIRKSAAFGSELKKYFPRPSGNS